MISWFKYSQKSFENDPKSSCSYTLTTDNIKKVRKTLSKDVNATFRILTEVLGVSIFKKFHVEIDQSLKQQ